jgi:hypothetical protein
MAARTMLAKTVLPRLSFVIVRRKHFFVVSFSVCGVTEKLGGLG